MFRPTSKRGAEKTPLLSEEPQHGASDPKSNTTGRHSESANGSFGRFLSPTGAALGYEAQEFCYLSETAGNMSGMVELMMKTWGLQRPNLILEVLGPLRPHPCRLLVKQALVLDEVEPFVAEAKSSLSVADGARPPPAEKPPSSASPEVATGDTDEIVLGMLGKRLFEKLVDNMVSILRACEQTSSWITCQEGPQITWLLMAEALSRCDARPTIIVCEKKDNYQSTVWDTILGSARVLGPQVDRRALPLTVVPAADWPDHCGFEMKENGIADEPVGQFICSFATHYIFSDSWFPITWSKLGPKGTVYIAGGSGCAKSMASNLAKYEPCVFMLHTGRAADLFGLALRIIKEDTKATADVVISKMNEAYPFWYARVELDRPGDESDIFGICSRAELYNHVSGMISLQRANPRRFNDCVVVINSWTSTPADVLNKLSECFGAASQGVASLDVSTADAKEESIHLAWSFHRQLKHNGKRFKRTANAMTILGALLSVATTAVSIGEALPELGGQDRMFGTLLDTGTIVLSALSGLIVTMLSHFRVLSKWGAMHVSMKQIESEIWQFRASCCDYDPMAVQKAGANEKNEGDKEGAKIVKPDAWHCQRVFSSRVSHLYTRLLNREMQTDSFTMLAEASQRRGASAPEEGDEEGDEEAAQPNPQTSNVSGEEYFELRLTPQLRRLEAKAPKLSRRLTVYELLVMLSTLLTTVMAALDYRTWIPVAVAVSGMLTAFMQYEALQGQLVAVNGAIAEMAAFTCEWAAMGVLERRGRLVKNRMVRMTEAALAREAMAFTGGTAHMGGSSQTGPDALEDADGKKKRGQKKEE